MSLVLDREQFWCVSCAVLYNNFFIVFALTLKRILFVFFLESLIIHFRTIRMCKYINYFYAWLGNLFKRNSCLMSYLCHSALFQLPFSHINVDWMAQLWLWETITEVLSHSGIILHFSVNIQVTNWQSFILLTLCNETFI